MKTEVVAGKKARLTLNFFYLFDAVGRNFNPRANGAAIGDGAFGAES